MNHNDLKINKKQHQLLFLKALTTSALEPCNNTISCSMASWRSFSTSSCLPWGEILVNPQSLKVPRCDDELVKPRCWVVATSVSTAWHRKERRLKVRGGSTRRGLRRASSRPASTKCVAPRLSTFWQRSSHRNAQKKLPSQKCSRTELKCIWGITTLRVLEDLKSNHSLRINKHPVIWREDGNVLPKTNKFSQCHCVKFFFNTRKSTGNPWIPLNPIKDARPGHAVPIGLASLPTRCHSAPGILVNHQLRKAIAHFHPALRKDCCEECLKKIRSSWEEFSNSTIWFVNEWSV